MAATVPVIICLAYIGGLLLTAVPYGGWGILGLGIGIGFTIRRFCRTAPPAKIWILAGLIGLLATLYFQVRIPRPGAQDISRLLSDTHTASVDVLVEGRVTSLPHLTQSHKAQFWLAVQRVAPIGDNRPVNGKLYVTVPCDQATDLHPGQLVSVGGSLYLPKPATNPGGFDFRAYLQQESSFAGLNGKEIQMLKDGSGWGLWRVQQRIVQAQAQGLAPPTSQVNPDPRDHSCFGADCNQAGNLRDPSGIAPLVSSMVLGSKGVNLPSALKQRFGRVGLAHALAASGFQTSLILAVVLMLTATLSEGVQFSVGTASLAGFVGLAGLQPAVLRAGLMGFATLLARGMNRKINPLGSLVMAATLLLVLNPLWIWDLGFQLSFLATMGLIVTVPPLSKRLDWLPTEIAALIAVPMAAYLWTLPLQIFAFGVLSPYSILVNILTTLLISIISLGGMVSAVAALIWGPAGSALAWPLKFPTQALIAIVDRFDHLPGNAYAIGSISALLAILLYGLLGLATFHPWWQRRWWVALLTGVTLVAIAGVANGRLTQVTVLDTGREPTMVIRDQGRITVMGRGDCRNGHFTLLPYLAKIGANQINLAINPQAQSSRSDGWQELSQAVSVKNLYSQTAVPALPQATQRSEPSQPPQIAPVSQLSSQPLSVNQPIRFGAVQFTLLSGEPAIAQLVIQNQTWLWLGSLAFEKQETLAKSGSLPQAQVLWWSGKSLHPALVEAIHPTVAIATQAVDPITLAYLRRAQVHLFSTGQDGAIQWTANDGFQPIRESDDNLSTAL